MVQNYVVPINKNVCIRTQVSIFLLYFVSRDPNLLSTIIQVHHEYSPIDYKAFSFGFVPTSGFTSVPITDRKLVVGWETETILFIL